MKRRTPPTVIASIPVLVLISLSLALGAEEKAAKSQKAQEERFSAWVVSAGGALPSQTGRLFMTVESWSTPEERAALLDALKTNGADGLKRALEDMNKGWMRFGDTLRWTVNHAVSFDTEKGRVLRLVTVRPILFVETARSMITMDYPFGMVEITLDENGKGEGVLIPAAKVKFNDKGQIEVQTTPENIAPARLNKVSKDK